MLISTKQIVETTSSGIILKNTNALRGLCHQIIVYPESDDTIYDIYMTNNAGAVVYERTSEVGTMSEFITMPVLGVYTIKIENATKDEQFKIQLCIQE